MTNKEKYKTQKDRESVFCTMCNSHKTCVSCPLYDAMGDIFYSKYQCYSQWLELDEDIRNINKVIEDVMSVNHFSIRIPIDEPYNENKEN